MASLKAFWLMNGFMKNVRKRLKQGITWGRLGLIWVCILAMLRTPNPTLTRTGKIKQALAGYEFNYVAWEVDALWQKAQQMLFGYHAYIDETQGKGLVIDYLIRVGRVQTLDSQIEQSYALNTPEAKRQRQSWIAERDALLKVLRSHQFLVEPIIEDHIEAVLRDLGFATGGQVVPPVSFRFVNPPDVLVVSPRHTIQQDLIFSLRTLSPEEVVYLENKLSAAVPDDSVRVTGIGGVGIYPAMVQETRFAAFAYEVVAHEWAHHYLFLYPSGQQYLATPEARIINETTATVFGNALGLLVLERFYADEVAQGRVFVPDYPNLADFSPPQETAPPPSETVFVLPTEAETGIYQERIRATADYLMTLNRPDLAQQVLNTWNRLAQVRGFPPTANPMPGEADQGVMLNRTRLTTDYLLALGHIPAAEMYMDAQGRKLGIRRLNQAWFAFYGGYQAEPIAGGGVDFSVTDVTDPAYRGDPIGPAIQEIYELAPTPYDFLLALRDITTREALLNRLVESRRRWGRLPP
jgi:hypothetical protein